jgi:hypothetical protein
MTSTYYQPHYIYVVFRLSVQVGGAGHTIPIEQLQAQLQMVTVQLQQTMQQVRCDRSEGVTGVSDESEGVLGGGVPGVMV